MTTIYLALGSNLGDPNQRLDSLREAVALLEQTANLEVEAVSKIYETQSVDTGGESDFFNAVVRGKTSLSALELLHHIHRIELQLGRPEPAGPGVHRAGSRRIDIDILLFGEEFHASPQLQIPHPRALSRNFVLRPLLDVLVGGWVEETQHQL